jgi:hypothetical protein
LGSGRGHLPGSALPRNRLPLPALLGALLDVPGLTARRALLPELGALAGVTIDRVSATFEANQNIGLLIGPPLAGLLVTWLGPSNVLWIDAASFALSAVVIGAAGFRPSALAAATLAQSVGMVMLLLPVLREMDRPSDEAM